MTIDNIKQNKNVQSYIYKKYNHEFLYNEDFKTAILLKCAAVSTEPKFVKKRMKKKKISLIKIIE